MEEASKHLLDTELKETMLSPAPLLEDTVYYGCI
jgi:hypothetical protein